MLKTIEAVYLLKIFIDNDFTKSLGDTLKDFGINDKVTLGGSIGSFTISMNMEEEKISDYNLRDQILSDLEAKAVEMLNKIIDKYNNEYGVGMHAGVELKEITVKDIVK